MKRRRNIHVLAAVGTMALLGLVPGVAQGARATSGKPLVSAVKVGPIPFGDVINQAGLADFANTYAGAYQNKDGSVTVYATSANGPLRKAIEHIVGSSKNKFTIVVVPRSYSRLDEMTMRIAKQDNYLRAHGISLAFWGPDPASGTVSVSLASPTVRERRALAAAISESPAAITTSRYPSAVQTALNSRFGPGISVRKGYQPPVTPDYDRRNDVSPYNGGDYIISDQNAQCTGGFAVESNTSTQTFMLTAGHCGYGAWYVSANPNEEQGIVNQRYFNNPNYDDDFEMIETSAQGEVWGGPATAPVSYAVVGSPLLPIPGSSNISWDGSNTREIRGISVISNDMCALEGTVTVCHLIESPNSPQVVQGGDSGGPVFQHTCETCLSVRAVGTIVSSNANDAFAEYVGTETSRSDTHILDAD